jgi:hypothetical protein
MRHKIILLKSKVRLSTKGNEIFVIGFAGIIGCETAIKGELKRLKGSYRKLFAAGINALYHLFGVNKAILGIIFELE